MSDRAIPSTLEFRASCDRRPRPRPTLPNCPERDTSTGSGGTCPQIFPLGNFSSKTTPSQSVLSRAGIFTGPESVPCAPSRGKSCQESLSIAGCSWCDRPGFRNWLGTFGHPIRQVDLRPTEKKTCCGPRGFLPNGRALLPRCRSPALIPSNHPATRFVSHVEQVPRDPRSVDFNPDEQPPNDCPPTIKQRKYFSRGTNSTRRT